MPDLLIAEDDPDIRELLSFRLAAAGHAVTAVEDGPSALDTAADDYMTKPFSPRELVSRIEALLARRDRGPSPERSWRRC